MGLLTGLDEKLAVQDVGVDNVTVADGLAVKCPSGFVGRAMQRMIDGYYTVDDEELYALLTLMSETQNIRLEPSALAGAPGFARVSNEQQGYRARLNLDQATMRNATHIFWATGGGMVPEMEMSAYVEMGRRALVEA